MKSIEHLLFGDSAEALVVDVYDVDVGHGERCLLADLHVFT